MILANIMKVMGFITGDQEETDESIVGGCGIHDPLPVIVDHKERHHESRFHLWKIILGNSLW
jgi:hypothetical protein